MSKKNKKAFVDGVNVLDSNPKAYKYVKKKIKKAGDGDKFVKAGELARQHLQQSKAPDWNNIDYGYNSMLKAGIPHNQAIGVMANAVQENRGSSKGAGIIQWIENVPKGSEAQWKSVIDSIVNPANTYNRQTDSMDNWWGKFGKINGKEAQKRFKNPNTSPSEAAEIYSASYIRPGKPEIEKRKFFAQQLDSIYNPRIKDKLVKVKKSGGLISKAQEGTKFIQWLSKNSGLIEGGLNLLGNGLQTISNQSKIGKFSKEFDAATKAQVKAAKAKAINDAYQQGLQITPYLNQYNAGDEVVNNSDIANRAFAWNYANTNADSTAGLEAERALEKQQAIEEMSKSIQGSGANIGSFISGIAGKIGQYLGGSKATAPSIVTPIKDYVKEFKQNTNPSINNSNFKVAMAMKDPTYRLPNYTLPSISDYKFSWNK